MERKHRGSEKLLSNWTNLKHLYLCISGYTRRQISLFQPFLLEPSVICKQGTNYKAGVVLKHSPQIIWHFCYQKVSSMSPRLEFEWAMIAVMIRVW